MNLTQSRILISGNSRSGTTSFASQFMRDHRYFSEITRRDIPRRFAELSHDGPITVSDIENRLDLVCSTKRSLCKFLINHLTHFDFNTQVSLYENVISKMNQVYFLRRNPVDSIISWNDANACNVWHSFHEKRIQTETEVPWILSESFVENFLKNTVMWFDIIESFKNIIILDYSSEIFKNCYHTKIDRTLLKRAYDENALRKKYDEYNRNR